MRGTVERTLLIDDSDIDLFIQRRFLEVNNFSKELFQYKSAEEALEWLNEIREDSAPDIIFLDLNMPESDGFAFLDSFKRLSESVQAKCKIVVLTSSNSVIDRDQAFAFKNVIHFITKPLKKTDLEELAKLISQN